MGRTHSVSDSGGDRAEGVRTGCLCVAEARLQAASWAHEEAEPIQAGGSRGPLRAEGVGTGAAQGRLCSQ